MNETLTKTSKWRETAFIAALYQLSEDRGAMAKLRRGLTAENPMADPDAASVLGSLLYGIHELDERRYFLIAGLFALTQTGAKRGPLSKLKDNPWEGDSLGLGFRRMRSKEIKERGLNPEEPTSLDARFVALLNSDYDDLPVRLRQAVRLLASREIAIDWARLLWDIGDWQSPGRKVQERWARDYWKRGRKETESKETSNNKTEEV